jgi:steroid delta-isomerase-like uncharacterized protein
MHSSIKDRIIKAWSQAWDTGNVDAFDAIITDSYTRKGTQSQKVNGIDRVKQEILDIRAALPDLTTTIDQILIEEDRGAIYWHATGTFTESFSGVPPTGAEVTTYGSNLITFVDGKIDHERVTWDAHALLSDMGLKSLRAAFDDFEVETVNENFSGEPSREALKAFNRQFITGVTVVTTRDETNAPRGLAVNSYNSVSLDPPLVLVCVQKTSSTYPSLFRSKYMGINIMSRDQRDTLGVFASREKDKFAQVDWHEGEHGSPMITNSAASIEVEIKERFQALTHTVFIGRVLSAEASETEPLIYKAGKFFDSLNLEAMD